VPGTAVGQQDVVDDGGEVGGLGEVHEGCAHGVVRERLVRHQMVWDLCGAPN
jgi:hypothetical protein